ncbi:MAG TPA: glycosyl hydrolase family 28-related protein [Acidobacteriaceae bacterium]|nr:glycosyl hydrolase family 28-related protein [Acidobacteriaceae bacterium]
MDQDAIKLASRRQILSLGAAAGAAALFDAPQPAYAITQTHLDCCALNVRRFGASGDAVTDDSASFQRALDAAFKDGGGTVYAPPGKYLLKGILTVPDGVTLRGSCSCVPSHTGLRDRGQPKPGDDGTALFVTAGQGNEEGTAFLTLNTNSSVAGLTIYYPEQVTDSAPKPYPWTVAMRGKNPAIFDVELLNPYQGIDASQNERHNVRNITGQPLRRGVFVDAIYDIGRIENVHFNPWWNSGSAVYRWQMENGEAFIFGRADWEYVLNTFCFGYHVGYKFVSTATGECNGNFLGIGADDCNRAVLVEQSAVYGLLIANAEFTSFRGPNPTMVEVGPQHRGVVRISNSAFWGPCDQIAKIAGQGTVGFSDCTFVEWGRDGDRPAIDVTSGSVLIRGCEFIESKKHISLGEAVERAIVTGNLFRGPAQIQNASRGDVQTGFNAAS